MGGPSVKVPAAWLASEAVEDMGADVTMLMLTALGWSAEQLTNGVIPRRTFRKLWPVDDLDAALDVLVTMGEATVNETVIEFVNWRSFILSDSEVDHIRAGNAERQERYRRHQKGDHSMCERCSAVRNSENNGVTNAVSNAAPIRSAPIRSDSTGGREEERKAVASSGQQTTPGSAAPPAAVETRGNQEPAPPPDDPEIRLGIPRHPHDWENGCCQFAGYPQHGIHQGPFDDEKGVATVYTPGGDQSQVETASAPSSAMVDLRAKRAAEKAQREAEEQARKQAIREAGAVEHANRPVLDMPPEPEDEAS